MEFQFVSIAVSMLALTVSLVSLWKSTLAPFKLKLNYGPLRFALYKIMPRMSGGKATWWIPSIDMGFTFHNLGKCSSTG
jgi:hypothetical protein